MLALSVASVYFMAPRFKSVIYKFAPFAGPSTLPGLQAPLIALALYLRHGRLNAAQVTSLVAIVLLSGAAWPVPASFTDYAAWGLFASVMAILLWPETEADRRLSVVTAAVANRAVSDSLALAAMETAEAVTTGQLNRPADEYD